MKILVLLINLIIIALFFYSKVYQHRNLLMDSYASMFNFCDKVFGPILAFIRKYAGVTVVGRGISVDMSQIYLLILLLVINAILLG